MMITVSVWLAWGCIAIVNATLDRILEKRLDALRRLQEQLEALRRGTLNSTTIH